ncbi:WapI family immunity protein [Marinobacter sp. PE14]
MMQFSGHGLECEIGFSMPDVEGWMHTTVSLKAPSFEGAFSCTIEVEEWKSLVRVLRKLDSAGGERADAVWANMEENIEFSFLAHPRGAMEISYRFSPDCFSLGPTLSGTFEADQTFLTRWITEAEAVLSHDH